jgi:putative transposase
MPAKFDPKIHHRRSIRLRGYDYAQVGAYFVTIDTFQQEYLFGEIDNGEMALNAWGQIVQNWWDDIPNHFPGVETGAFVIMPNHVHGIIIITAGRGAVPAPIVSDGENQGGETPGRGTLPLQWTKKPTLGQIVAYFKYKSTKEINALTGEGVVTKLWQRNYYERIIRNEREMDAIWRYIEANPENWGKDKENIHP